MWIAVTADSETLKAKKNPGRGVVPPLADYADDQEVQNIFDDLLESKWPTFQKILAAGTVDGIAELKGSLHVATGLVK
jgi:hypothetical protein